MKTEYFLERKSCRQFSQEKIHIKEVTAIIEKASKAPTCGNMQLYSVIITQDPDRLAKLSTYHYNQPAASTAPMILTICADLNRFTKWCNLSNAKSGFDNFHSFITALIDAVIFTQQIVTISEMEGYGTCYLGTVIYNAAEISKMFDLPELVIPVTSLAIGFPKDEGEETIRLKPEVVMHLEKYRHDNDNDIIEFHKEQENFSPNRRFIDENKKDNLAQVFSEIRYPKELNESISKKMIRLLKDKRFFK